jgi:hypothetical protein
MFGGKFATRFPLRDDAALPGVISTDAQHPLTSTKVHGLHDGQRP